MSIKSFIAWVIVIGIVGGALWMTTREQPQRLPDPMPIANEGERVPVYPCGPNEKCG